MKFAAIDIGSNAVRLLLAHVYEGKGEANFKKADLVRVPLRLGEDAFLHKRISDQKIAKLVMAMKAFRQLIDFYEVEDYKACATSAMREATNAKEVIEIVRRESGITIEVIDGKTEAQIIYSNHIAELMDSTNNYLYIDVGGGSTELTIFSKGKIISSRSFNVGTIRLLNGIVTKEQWNEVKEWIARKTPGLEPLVAIGSGGNINKIFKMSRKKQNRPMSFAKLKELHEFLSSYSLEDRIEVLGLNPDRADVIVPAGRVFLMVMKTAAIDKLFVPQIGMADGLIHLLYENYKARNKKGLVFAQQ
ncbi:MAG TPA: exopolyphosphatase [Bacteroidia bacterium]|nr:exopolyphosphatase [Bacteroidia bacterium]